MVSDDYWKDKTVDGKQVVSAWILVSLLAMAAYCADVVTRGRSCDASGSARMASAADSRDGVGIRIGNLR